MTGTASRVAVIASTGLVGHQLVDLLHESGHDIVEVSRESGADVLTGDGLDDALEGVDVVIDVVNSPAPDDSSQACFEQASSNLAAVARRTGVGHYVVLSIVGTDVLALGAGYMRGKLAQERSATQSGGPFHSVP